MFNILRKCGSLEIVLWVVVSHARDLGTGTTGSPVNNIGNVNDRRHVFSFSMENEPSYSVLFPTAN